jgi:hypothetical protein
MNIMDTNLFKIFSYLSLIEHSQKKIIMSARWVDTWNGQGTQHGKVKMDTSHTQRFTKQKTV